MTHAHSAGKPLSDNNMKTLIKKETQLTTINFVGLPYGPSTNTLNFLGKKTSNQKYIQRMTKGIFNHLLNLN